jgi:hypothetical protein
MKLVDSDRRSAKDTAEESVASSPKPKGATFVQCGTLISER